MSWDSVLGHDRIRDQFAAAYRRGRLGQAYLFAGPAGVGKRLFAHALGAAMLCEAPPGPLESCGRCLGCKLAAADTHPDLFTAGKPDDKMELPVEVVRDLSARLALKPSRGTRKVAILEDADDLNEESANAFLKTLEEPPPGSLLILLATAAETQLSTIRSRCQLVTFRPVSPEIVRQVLAAHGVADEDRAARLVKLARGSPGQAVALNDDDLWEFRGAFAEAVAAARPNPQQVAEMWGRFVEDAGKESAGQRRRAALVVRLLMDLVSAALRTAVGGAAADDPAAAALAARVGPDGLLALLESCVDADYHIDRRVPLALVIDGLSDKLTRPAA